MEYEVDRSLEQLVNNHQNKQEIRDEEDYSRNINSMIRKNRHDRMCCNACYNAIGAALSGVLMLTGCIPSWLALPAMMVTACVSSVNVGSLLEMNRRK